MTPPNLFGFCCLAVWCAPVTVRLLLHGFVAGLTLILWVADTKTSQLGVQALTAQSEEFSR